MFIFRQILIHFLILCFLIITLIPQNVTAANIAENFQNFLKPDTDYLSIINNIPEHNGRIFETNITDNEKPNLILIYDRHGNAEVQKNIYSIIKHYNSFFDIDKIFVEGAPLGKINISPLQNISSDLKIKEKIFNKMLNKELLSGTEYFSYLSKKDNLYGIENFDLYKETVKQYADILNKQNNFLKIIKKSFKDLNKTKKYVYNEDMKFFEKIFFGGIKYTEKDLKKIYALFEKYNINILRDYPQVYKYLKIKEYNFTPVKDAKKDFQNLLNTAQIKLPASIYIKLLNKIKENTANQNIGQNILPNLILLYNNTKQFLSDKQLNEYEYIENLQNKNLFLKDFNVKNFLKEKNSLYDNAVKKFFTADFSKDLICLYEYLILIKRFCLLRCDSESFNRLLYNMQEFQNILLNRNLLSDSQNVINILNNKDLKSYYDNNLKRNDIFVENVLKNIKKNSVNILVIGGFHKDITVILNGKNIKYAAVLPGSQDKGSYETYNKVMTDTAAFYNAVADTPLAAMLTEQGLNEKNFKIREFLISWIEVLKEQKLTDKQIIKTINFWARNYKEATAENENAETDTDKTKTEAEAEKEADMTEAVFSETNKQPQTDDSNDIENFVLKQNKFSPKGLLLKIRDFFNNFKTVFTFKYTKEDGEKDIELDKKTIKKIERNIRHFPVIQIMLASELFESFAMLFMQSSGFSLPFISAVIAVLPFISFVISGMGTFAGNKIPKKVLIAGSLIIHTIGTISFALSGLTGLPVLLVIAQVFPTIGVAALSLTLKPFLYEQLEALGKEKYFDKIYGTNRSLFWFAMSLSSLFGSLLAALISRVFVVGIAVIPDIVITSLTIITFLSTRNIKLNKKNIDENIKQTEKDKKEVKAEKHKETKTFKERILIFFEPLMNLSKDKRALSFAAVNVIVNNIFFVVLGFFFQTSLEAAGLNIAFFGAIYFASDIIHGLASNLIDKVRFIVENKHIRNIIFMMMSGLFAVFVITGHPIAFILIFAAMNFWQGAAELAEDSAVYKVLDNGNQVRWNAFRSMFAMITGFISQISITGLLFIGLPHNVIIAGAMGILTFGSFIISFIFDRNSKTETASSDTLPAVSPAEFSIIKNSAKTNIAGTDNIKQLLYAA